jgi:succinoglycan biosynthesis protein ExoL
MLFLLLYRAIDGSFGNAAQAYGVALSVKIAYFVHDLCDPAVTRRVRMLLAGGAVIRVIGFRRNEIIPSFPEGVSVVDLGRTTDGQLAKRMLSVTSAMAFSSPYIDHVKDADVLLARNLEMLAIAHEARRRYVPNATLVYECLDIHRLLLSRNVPGFLVRALEAKLWQSVDLLLTSSPAFIRYYFAPRDFPAPFHLVENKVMLDAAGRSDGLVVERPLGPPWRIGWFGAIRCRRSLDILRNLTQVLGSEVEVVIRGRLSEAVFPDVEQFEKSISSLPGITFLGPYKNPDDLAAIYSQVHFNWATDFYESDANSKWLLPNRLYEGTLFDAVPIADATVETGAWLKRNHLGVALTALIEENLIGFFRTLTPDRYADLAKTTHNFPRSQLTVSEDDCRQLIGILRQPFGTKACDLEEVLHSEATSIGAQ